MKSWGKILLRFVPLSKKDVTDQIINSYITIYRALLLEALSKAKVQRSKLDSWWKYKSSYNTTTRFLQKG